MVQWVMVNIEKRQRERKKNIKRENKREVGVGITGYRLTSQPVVRGRCSGSWWCMGMKRKKKDKQRERERKKEWKEEREVRERERMKREWKSVSQQLIVVEATDQQCGEGRWEKNGQRVKRKEREEEEYE